MTTVLVVDDEKNIVKLAELYLSAEGFDVISAGDGATALETVKDRQPDLIVLDIMLPEIDGWEVCRRLRRTSQVPIIMLTARSDDVDKIVGLELGADDYVVKPFNPRELVARVKAVLRRTEAEREPHDVLNVGDVRIDIPSREVYVKGEAVSLRAKEFDLLAWFARHQGMVLTRNQLLDAVWGYEFYGDTRTVDVHVAHLRDKLEGSNVAIETVWGVGYKLVGPAARDQP